MPHYIKDIIRIWNILKPFHKYFYIQLGLIIISQGLVVAIAFGQSTILNLLVGKKITLLIYAFIAYAFLFVIDVFIDYLAKRNNQNNLDQMLYQHLQEFSYKKILSLTPAQHIEDHSAIKLTVISKGETAIQSIVDKIISNIIPTITLAIITIITLYIHSPLLAVISTVIITVTSIWSFIFQRGHHKYITKNRDLWNEQSRQRTEAFTHLQTIKLLHREEYFLKSYLKKRFEAVRHNMATVTRSTKHSAKRHLFTEISVISTFAIASYLYLSNAYTIGTVYLILSLINRLYWNFDAFSTIMRQLPQHYADAERYFVIIDKVPSFSESGNKDANLRGDIIFSQVSFRYDKSESKVFNNLSFTIPANKITAFVGSSGSGKSTIVKLLLRAYDYKDGSIAIGENELKTIDAGHIRERVGYVEQHVDLLDDTIRENIIITLREKERRSAESKLEEIAHLARIDQFYHRLGEKKFDTYVGERGVKLSGGERQRVGIARAIIKDPDILIFDEATSALDSENEKYVMEAINDVSKGKTTVIIAHRLSTVRSADKIIVMDKGRVIGEGTHDELMATNNAYQNLVAHQLS
jgi:ABC-type multidrug transport system fused ATPase/permease subunit